MSEKLSKDDLLRCLSQKDKYKGVKPYLVQLSASNNQVLQIVNAVLVQAIVQNKTTYLSKLLALRFFKDILLTGSMEVVDELDQSIEESIVKTATYNPKSRELGKGANYFVEVDKWKKDAEITQMSSTYVLMSLEIIFVFAKWYPIDEEGKQSRFKEYYKKLCEQQVAFPCEGKLNFFKEEDHQRFIRNYDNWLKTLGLAVDPSQKEKNKEGKPKASQTEQLKRTLQNTKKTLQQVTAEKASLSQKHRITLADNLKLTQQLKALKDQNLAHKEQNQSLKEQNLAVNRQIETLKNIVKENQMQMQIFTSKIALGNVITEEQKMIVETMKLEFGVLTDCLNKLRKNEAEKVSLSKIIAENCKLSQQKINKLQAEITSLQNMNQTLPKINIIPDRTDKQEVVQYTPPSKQADSKPSNYSLSDYLAQQRKSVPNNQIIPSFWRQDPSFLPRNGDTTKVKPKSIGKTEQAHQKLKIKEQYVRQKMARTQNQWKFPRKSLQCTNKTDNINHQPVKDITQFTRSPFDFTRTLLSP